MFTPKKALRRLMPLLLCSTAAGAQLSGPSTPPHPPVNPPTQSVPPPSSNGVFPLADVHAGLHGTAWTVFTGSVPEPFGVDVLGVLKNAQGPGEDLILARLTGAKAEYTGVVAGMSGSPVYIDGKLVGALAFRIGEFAKEPIAGITPIAQMLPVRDEPAGAGAGETAGLGAAGQPETLAQIGSQIRPMETPLVFSGFSPAALELWKQQMGTASGGALGLRPQAGLGGGAAPAGSPDTAPPLEPGSAVSALMVAGDLEIAATCTVTYLDANRLLACGHPLTQFGTVSLPMAKADVVATLPSPAGSFKIVNTGATVGAFTEDRQTGIGGRVGAEARMIPVEIALRESEGKPERTLHIRVLDQAQVTPTAIIVSLFQVLQETPGYSEESSYRVHAAVQLEGYPPVQLETLATPGGLVGSAIGAALSVGLRFNSLYSSGTRRTPIESVRIEVETLPGRRSVTLRRAVIEQTRLHAGDHITLDATLDRYRGSPVSLRIPVVLPASLPAGDVRLLVSDGPTLDRLMAVGRAAGDTPLASTVAQLNGLHGDDRLYVSVLSPNATVSVDGRALDAVPLSVANLLLPAHEADRGSLHGESVQTLGSAALENHVAGEQILTLRVE